MPTENKFVFILAEDLFHVFPNGTNYHVFESLARDCILSMVSWALENSSNYNFIHRLLRW